MAVEHQIALPASSEDLYEEEKSRAHIAAVSEWRAVVQQAESSDASMQALHTLQNILELRRAPPPYGEAWSPGFLRACLRAKMYDVHKAFDLCLTYVGFRKKARWHTGDATEKGRVTAAAPDVAAGLNSGLNMLLPHPDVHGHIVLSQQMSKLGTEESLESLQRAGFYLLHRALERPGAQTKGLALLLDFREFSFAVLRRVRISDIRWAHARRIHVHTFATLLSSRLPTWLPPPLDATPSISLRAIRRGVIMLQDCFPAKLATIYVVHQPWWIVSLVAILRPFLRSSSLQQKFKLFGADYASLHEHIPASTLPASLNVGGTLEEFDWAGAVDGWVAEETAWGGEIMSKSGGHEGGANAAAAALPFDPSVLIERGARGDASFESALPIS